MMIRPDGSQVGTIGGGIMESRAIDDAVDQLRKGQQTAPELCRMTHRRGAGEQGSGLICGGEQYNLRLLLDPGKDLGWVERAARAEAEEKNERLEITGKGVSWLEGSGDRQYELVEREGDWAYRFSFLNLRRIAVFGGGHCGVELASLMDRLGYAVTLVEPRADLFTLADLPADLRSIRCDFEAAAAEVEHPEKTLAVVMTYSMATDVEALRGILNGPFPFVGLMGSRAKIRQIKEELGKSFAGDLHLSRVRAPIGLEFNSDTPQEIAVSVAAQILLEREAEEQNG
jgi:xanthine dehydrogenase accessory factor